MKRQMAIQAAGTTFVSPATAGDAVAGDRTVFLMYHEIEAPGRALCETAPGYLRYVVKESEFSRQLECLRASGCDGVSVGEALDGALDGIEGRGPRLAITFDDGCETDWVVAAPLLAEFGFNATFYVIAGNVGSPGYLSATQLRQLAGAGFEIGCHSMTHSYLNGLSADRLRVELVDARDRLEQLSQTRIKHFSCPGGRWNRRVAHFAEAAGYESVVTSRIGINSAATDRFSLARLAVMRGTENADFARTFRGERLIARRARVGALRSAKAIFGNTFYERIRAALLNHS